MTDSGRTFHHNPFYGMDLWEKCKTFRKQGQNTDWLHATMSYINIKESPGCTLTRQDFQNLDVTQTFAEDGHLRFYTGIYASRSGAHSSYWYSVKTDDLLPSKVGKIQTHSRLASRENEQNSCWRTIGSEHLSTCSISRRQNASLWTRHPHPPLSCGSCLKGLQSASVRSRLSFPESLKVF